MNRTGGNARRLFRWTLAVGLGLVAVGTGVFWSGRHRNPAPGLVGPFISPWSTRMTGVVAPEKKVSWTFTMVNQRGQSLSVKPWTHPFHLILTPLGGGKPIVRGAAFPKLLTIPAHQSRQWTATVPTPPPGWYDAATSTVGVDQMGCSTWDRTALGGAWFSPYPADTLRTGTLLFDHTVRHDGYTVHLTFLTMSDRQAKIAFQVAMVPYFPTNYTVEVMENGQAVDTWGGSQRTPEKKPFARHVPLIAMVTLNPIPKTVTHLTVSITDLGINGSATKTVPGPWIFPIHLPITP